MIYTFCFHIDSYIDWKQCYRKKTQSEITKLSDPYKTNQWNKEKKKNDKNEMETWAKCPFCGKARKTKVLKQHINSAKCQNYRWWQCLLCELDFVSKRDCKDHHRMKHQPKDEVYQRPYECRKCYKRFSRNQTLKNHKCPAKKK